MYVKRNYSNKICENSMQHNDFKYISAIVIPVGNELGVKW